MGTDSANGPSIGSLRKEVDRIDDRLLELLNQRADIAMEIGGLKATARPSGQTLRVSAREKSILRRLEQNNRGPFPFASIELIFNEIFKTCLKLQK